MPTTEPLLKLNNVTRSHGAPGRTGGVLVLAGISLEVAGGGTLAIVGPSGSGKSTLLQIIGSLDRPTSGRVLLDGRGLDALDDQQLAEVRNRQIGFVFQAHHLLPQCTAIENVLVPTLVCSSRREPAHSDPQIDRSRLMSAATETDQARASRLLDRVGLGGRRNHLPGQLSGGERQRVAVVRALINRPRLLLADEPTGALDHASATALGRLLVELNKEEGVALIVATHSMDLAAQMGRVLELQDGRLVQR
jgi:ABC-type lipoprotein export system ATPase subunit